MAGTTAVQFKVPLDGALRASLVESLAKYWLYMRGQLPCVYDQLEAIVIDAKQQKPMESETDAVQLRQPQRRLAAGPLSKATKCVDATTLLFREGLPSLFSTRVQIVALLLGPSLLSPREALVVDFSAAVESDVNGDKERVGADPNAAPGYSKEKLERLCAQKLLRTLLSNGAFLSTGELAATQLHVAVLAEKCRDSRIPGFLPRQNFRLRLPKPKRSSERTHYIEISTSYRVQPDQSTTSDNVQDQNSVCLHEPAHPPAATDDELPPTRLAQGDDCASMIWYISERPIPGVVGVL